MLNYFLLGPGGSTDHEYIEPPDLYKTNTNYSVYNPLGNYNYQSTAIRMDDKARVVLYVKKDKIYEKSHSKQYNQYFNFESVVFNKRIHRDILEYLYEKA